MDRLSDGVNISAGDAERNHANPLPRQLDASRVGTAPGQDLELVIDLIALGEFDHLVDQGAVADGRAVHDLDRDPLAQLRDVVPLLHSGHVAGERDVDRDPDVGSDFGELLCWEIHENGMTFCWLARKWGISVSALGWLIHEHCKALENLPVVNHDYVKGG